MIDKLLQFKPYNELGEQVIIPISEGRLESFVKTAATYQPEIKQYIAKLTPDEKKTYLLINALGAGEYWSNNINGDFFGEKELINNYHTFLNAHPFEHHINKDPEKALGKVEMAVYNPTMHRIELIVSLDNEKAPHIVKRINEGEHPAMSMGARVKYDLCNICHNKARHIREYCDHLKFQMNKVMPGGKKVYAINPKPKFFDISFVLIGADRTAGVLKKVASAGAHTAQHSVSSALLALQYGAPKTAAEKKLAELYKDIPVEEAKVIHQVGNAMDNHILPELEASEKRFPNDVIDKLASYPLNETLATLTYSGIVLKPEEYQRLSLVKTGNIAIADMLEKHNIVFDLVGTEEAPDSFGKLASISSEIFKEIESYIPSRSAFSPYIDTRIMKLAARVKQGNFHPQGPFITQNSTGPAELHLLPEVNRAKDFAKLLAALGIGFAIYKKSVPKAEFSKLDRILTESPLAAGTLLAGLAGALSFGSSVNDLTPTEELYMGQTPMSKSAGFVSKVVTPISAAYLGAGYLKGSQARGKRLNRLESFIADNPALTLGAYYGLRYGGLLKKGAKKYKSSEEFNSVEKKAGIPGETLSVFAAGWLKPSLTNIVGNAIDMTAIAAAFKLAKDSARKKARRTPSIRFGKALRDRG